MMERIFSICIKCLYIFYIEAFVLILFFVDTIFIQYFFEICNIIFCLCSVISYKQLRAIPEKNT